MNRIASYNLLDLRWIIKKAIFRVISYLSDFGLEFGAGVVVEYSNKSKLSTG